MLVVVVGEGRIGNVGCPLGLDLLTLDMALGRLGLGFAEASLRAARRWLLGELRLGGLPSARRSMSSTSAKKASSYVSSSPQMSSSDCGGGRW